MSTITADRVYTPRQIEIAVNIIKAQLSGACDGCEKSNGCECGSRAGEGTPCMEPYE